ncbi:MAG: TolB family protein [Armatimonadota bacterium]
MTKRMALGLLLIGLLLTAAAALAQTTRQRIALQRFIPLAPSNILVMYRDGQSPQDLIQHKDITGKRITPALSPDGQTLAFGAQAGAHFQLFTWRLDEENNAVGSPVQLTRDSKADAKFPTWSPDGTKIAFLSTNESGKTTLRMINRDGTGLKVLLDVNYNNSSPSWKNDGQSLLFIDKIDGRPVLRLIPVLGGMVVDIRPKDTITAACFSPDGAKIAALIRRKDGLSDLWILAQSGVTGNIAVKGITGGSSIAWPDQQTIIFNAIKVDGQKAGNAFYAMSTKDRSLRSFTGYSDAKQVTHFSVQKVSPLDESLSVADIDDATGGNTPRERVPQGPVTIIRPFPDTQVRGVVPVKIIAQKRVNSIVLRINDQFTYTTELEASDDEVSRVTFNWDTQQLASIEPSRGSGIPAIYQDRNKKVQLRRYPDDIYTITVLALERDNQGHDQMIGKDSIKITVQNAIPDNELPGNITLRYQYREAEPDEEFLLQGEGTLFGAELLSIADLNATFNARIRRSLVDIRPNGNYDLRTSLRASGPTDSYPLTFGLKAVTRVPEEDVSALYTISPTGDLSVVPQMRERVFMPLAQIGLTFPGTAVQIGSQWQGQMWVVSELLGREGLQVRTNNIVDGVEWIGDHRTIRIRSDYRLDSQNNILPMSPTMQAPGNYDSMLSVQRNGLKIADAAGVRYTWYDYDRNQIVRMEDFLLYTFPLANVTPVATTPVAPLNPANVPSPGGYAPAPGGYAPAPGGYAPAPGGYAPAPGGYAPGMQLDPADTPPPGVYGMPPGAYGMPPGAMTGPDDIMPPGISMAPGGGGRMANKAGMPGANNFPPGAAIPPGMAFPPGMTLPPGMGNTPPNYMPPGAYTPPAGVTPPTGTTPPRTGTTPPRTGYTQPKPRSGNGYYLVRWSYLVPIEEEE